MSNYYDDVLCLAKTMRIYAGYMNCKSQLGQLDVYKTGEVTIEYIIMIYFTTFLSCLRLITAAILTPH